MTPGEISLAGYIEGFVVSDPASKNIVSSPQTGQYAFDRTENDRTVYLESTDGRYGFCLKFATEDDNTLERFSKVRLSLDGAILEKKAVPPTSKSCARTAPTPTAPTVTRSKTT